MKKILLLTLCTLFLFACDNSDAEIELPVYYWIENIEFTLEEGDGLVTDKAKLSSGIFVNDTDEYQDFIVPDTSSSSSEFVFIPETTVSFSFPPDYSYRMEIPENIENDEIVYTVSGHSYQENIPVYFEHSRSEGTQTFGIAPASKLAFEMLQDMEYLTFTYKMTLVTPEGDPLVVKGKFKRTHRLKVTSTVTVTPLD